MTCFTHGCDTRGRLMTGVLAPRFWHLALEKMVGQAPYMDVMWRFRSQMYAENVSRTRKVEEFSVLKDA